MAKKFLIKIILFIIIIGLGSTLLSFAIDNGLRNSNYSYYAQWNDLFQSKINADLLIIGSSRARQHFSTGVFDSALGLNSYVFGIEAYRFRMYYDLFQIYLHHNIKPEYLVISLDIYTLHEDSNSYYYQQFLPYLDEPDILNAYKSYKHSFTIGDRFLPLYKYRGNRTQIAVGLLEYIGLRHYPLLTRKGFSAFQKNWDQSFETFQKQNESSHHQKIDQPDIDLLQDLLIQCNRQGIKVILVFSPEFIGYQNIVTNRDEIIDLYHSISKKYSCYFFDFSRSSICKDTAFFYNSQHMNSKGSLIFSQDLATVLKTTISCVK